MRGFIPFVNFIIFRHYFLYEFVWRKKNFSEFYKHWTMLLPSSSSLTNIVWIVAQDESISFIGLLGSGRGDKVLIPELRRTRLSGLLSPTSGSAVEFSLEPVPGASCNILISVQVGGVPGVYNCILSRNIIYPYLSKVIYSPEEMNFFRENKKKFG